MKSEINKDIKYEKQSDNIKKDNKNEHYIIEPIQQRKNLTESLKDNKIM